MKKHLLVWGFFLAGAALIAAQDIDGAIKNAVDGLASRLINPFEVSVGEITLAGSESPSELSRYLYNRINAHAPNNSMFKVIPRTRGIDRVRVGPQKGVIKGTFLREGNMVRVTLQLISESSGAILASSDFTIPVAELDRLPIAILPENIKTQEEIKERENIFVPPAPPVPLPVKQAEKIVPQTDTFKIEAWPNSDSRTYIDGDEMKINIFANKDCYFKVYQIDVDKKMQLVYPNKMNPDNFLTANTTRIIPESPVQFILEKPFGLESILVMASGRQFENLEAEFVQIRQATGSVINNIRDGTTGMRLDATGDARTGTAETRFDYTILSANYSDETLSYKKPANMAEAIQTMRSEAQRQGGTFTGNDREGSFAYSGVRGSYRVSGDTVTINFRYIENQRNTTTRGAASYSFSFDKPRNLSQAVQSIRSGIEGKGGNFSGNEQQGNFRASGISGQYSVSDKVNVSIVEKPVLIPNSLIEKEVKNYFMKP